MDTKKVCFKRGDNLLDIRQDNVFKAVFTKNNPKSRGALSDLISALIDKKVSVSTITANEPPIDDIRDKQIRFDIHCKTEDNDLVNVEMSLHATAYELYRLEFYSAKLFTGQDTRGSYYKDLHESYQIAILANRRFFEDDDFYHSFEYYDKKRQVSLGGKSYIITLELIKLDNDLKKGIMEIAPKELWAFFFEYLTDESKREQINKILEVEEGIAMASEVLISITQDDIERVRLLSEYKYKMDAQAALVYAEKEGHKEGLQLGRKEGLQLGRSEGLQLGRSEAKLEIASNLKNSGLSVEQIATATGLTKEQIEQL